MRARHIIFCLTGCLSVVLLLLSCSGSQLKVEPVSTSENPSELIGKLEKDLANARRDQVNMLSPTWFARAESSLKAAQQGLADGDKLNEIYENIALCRAQLMTARDKSQLSRTILPEVIKSRDMARKAGATNFGDDYLKAEKRFLGLTEAIENDQLEYAKKNRAGLSSTYRSLELRAIKDRTLGEVRKLLAQARKQKTTKIAPRTYATAQKLLAEADAFITQNRYNEEEMRRKANWALFNAQRHLEIARQCRTIQELDAEEIVLQIEDRLHEIAVRLTAPDMRNQPLKTQMENILSTVNALEYERTALKEKVNEQQARVARLNQRVADLEGLTKEEMSAKERLLAEKRFNQLFEKVQTYFEPSEAEVYKTEGRLVIRLKAMAFPVGQSVILPKNYALLSKVQRAIRTFEDVDVIIEGHTDSTGSEQLNDYLSEQRADAVRQYLVANETLPYDKIIAVGYGSSRPLASNKTEKGRAINRRIDLIITPHFKSKG
jgi:outer membrane protein OmpA-like peptidoglycan-associated protein